jgi:hypothetical protein
MYLFPSDNTFYVCVTALQASIVSLGCIKDIYLKRVLLAIRCIDLVELRRGSELQAKEYVLRMLINVGGTPEENHFC